MSEPQALLQEMGYRLWHLRPEWRTEPADAADMVAASLVTATAETEAKPAMRLPEPAWPTVQEADLQAAAGSEPACLPDAVPDMEPVATPEPVIAPPSGSDSSVFPAAVATLPVPPLAAASAAQGDGSRAALIAGMGWEELGRAVQECRACELCERRQQAVLGVGDQQADWLFVGEGPGAEEDVQGEPFVGQAGKLLDAMLAAIDLQRGKNVYIANAVKCRPEGNRTPHAAEISACRPFLQRQIELLQPRLIVLLGKAALQAVLDEDKTLGSLRQQVLRFRDIPVLVTYHPAYLLRNLPEKAKAWEDLCLARRLMQASPPA